MHTTIELVDIKLFFVPFIALILLLGNRVLIIVVNPTIFSDSGLINHELLATSVCIEVDVHFLNEIKVRHAVVERVEFLCLLGKPHVSDLQVLFQCHHLVDELLL